MIGDPPNEYHHETTKRIVWFTASFFLTMLVKFVLTEYKQYQARLNTKAELKYKDEL